MMDIDGGLTDWTYEQEKGRLEQEAYEKACREAGESIREASADLNNPWHQIAEDEREHPVTGKQKPLSPSELNKTIKNMRR